MLKISDLGEWRSYANDLRAKGDTVGLVPTMGSLHDGHVALVRAAKDRGDVVLLSVFVNPRQFDDSSDLVRYPRTPEHDLAVALSSGVDCLIEPTLASLWPLYPAPTPTTVSVGPLGTLFEGTQRPGHFDGVASVVAKLFALTGPSRAYFGEKDFQQLAVVRQLVRDLAFDVEVVGCAVVRDPDGLALSSRNQRLSPEGRTRALALARALSLARDASGPASVRREVLRRTLEESDVEVAYADVVDAASLLPSSDDYSGVARALVAAVVDGVRLLDNAPLTLEGR